jgi:HAD superfamily hydrolase (TIGR01509 family)
MIILIPIGGIGNRFKKEGFQTPKALIEVEGKPIIFHLIDNLKINNKISFIYIPYNKEYVSYDFENIIKNKYPHYKFKFLILQNQTRGAAESIFVALNKLFSDSIQYPIPIHEMKGRFDKPILCLDSDNFYLEDIISHWHGKNTIFTFLSKSENPIFSYVNYDSNEILTNIVEKNKISNDACCGAYGFRSYYELMKYCKKIINNNKTQLGEFYTSGIIKEMINDKIIFKNINIQNKNFYSLGTPNQIKIFNQTFLLDLDGTLVNTDPIYLKVWCQILKNYNINCNKNIFDSFIKGNSDIGFLKFLIPTISNDELINISKLKDKLFINFIQSSQVNLYDYVYQFFEKIQNAKIAIVTSSNKSAASFLIKHFKLDQYINLLITANDVQNHKPSPEPYLTAAELLKRKNNLIIFEDSESGFAAANKVKNSKIYLYNNGTNATTIDNIVKNNNIQIFDNYKNLDVIQIAEKQIDFKNEFLDFIFNTLKFLPIKKIYSKNNNNLKTGYICDIDCYIIQYFDNKEEEVIIKTSNYENELSKTAKKLNMYTNESYFYKHLANIINDTIDIPKCYQTFIYEEKKGIILENLFKYNGQFNLNLNQNIHLLINIVYNIFKLHNKYYFTNNEMVIDLIKPLKKINQITYYNELVKNRYHKFIEINKLILSQSEIKILNNIYNNYESILDSLSTFPLSMCHGDLKSPNIFYKNNKIPFFLDWQYVHLNKGISDIVFLLVESIEFDKQIIDIVLNYYFRLLKENRPDSDYEEFIQNFKNSLSAFPFFVMVWFNSEDQDKLIDSVFPIRFMKNLLKYYNEYLV